MIQVMKNICGVDFPEKFINEKINIFKESLAHNSLSCERAFDEMKKYEDIITEIRNNGKKSVEKIRTFSNAKRESIENDIKVFIAHIANNYCMFEKSIDLNDLDEVQLLYYNYFATDLCEIIDCVAVFDKNQELDKRATYQKTCELILAYLNYINAKKIAKGMKKDHIKAFDYAYNLKIKFNPANIIKLNSFVVDSDPNKELGYKKINTMIEGAKFSVVDKGLIPSYMNKLIHDYYDTYTPKINPYLVSSMKDLREFQICLKEAKFHIDFVRIHPFVDGNGRSGRIILNVNLLRNGMAPVLINEISMESYKEFIEKKDYMGFARWILENSHQTASMWISEYRHLNKIDDSDVGDINELRKNSKNRKK